MTQVKCGQPSIINYNTHCEGLSGDLLFFFRLDTGELIMNAEVSWCIGEAYTAIFYNYAFHKVA